MTTSVVHARHQFVIVRKVLIEKGNWRFCRLETTLRMSDFWTRRLVNDHSTKYENGGGVSYACKKARQSGGERAHLQVAEKLTFEPLETA
jgi:hypothetical protein